MVDRNASFRQHFLKVAIADRIATIPAHRPQDHITRKWSHLETGNGSFGQSPPNMPKAHGFFNRTRRNLFCKMGISAVSANPEFLMGPCPPPRPRVASRAHAPPPRADP